MGFAFNPFTGNFDLKGSGGGASYIDGEVATYADLPLDGAAAINSAWLVRTASGVWPVTRKQAGIYIRTATGGSNRDSDYTYAGTLPDVFSDSQFLIYDNADSTKNLAFDLGSISTGQTRTLTVPNASGRIQVEGQAIGNVTAAAGSFTTLSATGIVTGSNATTSPPTTIDQAKGLQFSSLGGTFGSTAGLYGSHTGTSTLGIGIANNSAGILTQVAAFTSTGLNSCAIGSSTPAAGNFTTFTLKDNTGGETATFDAQGKLTANRTYDLPNASGTLALTSRIPYAVFTATDNQPTASNFATIDTRNSIAVLDFDDAATESAVFVGIMPEAASLGSGLIVSLRWMATTATSGDVRWSVAWEDSNTDLDSDSFDTATAATATTNGTSGIVTVTNITCTTIDSLAAGDLFRLRVQRIGGDGADTMTGDAELVAVEIRSAA